MEAMISKRNWLSTTKLPLLFLSAGWKGRGVGKVYTPRVYVACLCQCVMSRLSYFADKRLKALNRNCAARRALVSRAFHTFFLLGNSLPLIVADGARKKRLVFQLAPVRDPTFPEIARACHASYLPDAGLVIDPTLRRRVAFDLSRRNSDRASRVNARHDAVFI